MPTSPSTTPDRAELLRRAAIARGMLSSCQLCEIRCHANRLAGDPAPCGLADETWCFKRHVSYAEEIQLLPSYMVYLGGCNFRCRFCVQAPQCFRPDGGTRLHALQAAADFAKLVAQGARTINLLGGEPSLHLHALLEIAAHAEQPLPLALNTNMYMTPQVIDLLDGVVETYIADFKFGNDACAHRLASIHRYVEVVTRNLLLVKGRANIILRHLVMPGHLDCCLEPVVRWISENLPGLPVTLMTGYVPAWRAAASGDPLGRCLTPEELHRAQSIAAAHGLTTDAP